MISAFARTEVYRMIHLKIHELELLREPYSLSDLPRGQPHPKAHQADK